MTLPGRITNPRGRLWPIPLARCFYLLFSGFRGRGRFEPPSPEKCLLGMLLIARSAAPKQSREVKR